MFVVLAAAGLSAIFTKRRTDIKRRKRAETDGRESESGQDEDCSMR